MHSLSEILNLIKAGESPTFEFKSSFNTDVIETLVAFANAGGGKVIVGVNKKGQITGVSINQESVQNWVNEIKMKTTPSLIPEAEIFEIENKTLVIFITQEYPVKPVATRGKYFKRVANSNHLMSLNEIAIEHLKTINSSWDFYPDPWHNIQHISLDKARKFIKRIERHTQAEINLEPLEFLTKFEIMRNGQLTFGGYLLFADDYCPVTDVQAGRFKSPVTIIDSISINSDLFTEVDEILFFIRKHLMVEYIITGEPQRTERFDYPIEAIREIVINMIVHRDYRESSHSIIKIFDDKIEFYNPGRLYGNLTVNDLLAGNYTSQTRNKLIAKAFKEVGLIERYGSGIRRIINICKNHGIIEPVFEEKPNGFMVTVFKKNLKETDVPENDSDRVTDRVTENQRIILNNIIKEPGISTNELAKLVGISQRKIKENIARLKEIGILKRIGPAKGGHWEIIEK